MGEGLSAFTAILYHFNRKRAIKKIHLANETAKNVKMLGRISGSQLFANTCMENNIISGALPDVRAELVIEDCRKAQDAGLPVIIIHAGNKTLESLFANSFLRSGGIIINKMWDYYAPILRRNATEATQLLAEASAVTRYSLDSDAAAYINSMIQILHFKNRPATVRHLSICPHEQLNMIIANLEKNHIITAIKADNIRSNLSSTETRNLVKQYLQSLAVSDILAGGNYSRCISIKDVIDTAKICIFDIASYSNQALLGIMLAELNEAAQAGKIFKVIFDSTGFLATNETILNTLKSNNFNWTLSMPDFSCIADEKSMNNWLSLSDKTILFSQKISTSDAISKAIGNYDHIDITGSDAGSNTFGKMGYHFGRNTTINTSIKRQPVIKGEKIANMDERQFILIERNSIYVGELL